MTEGNFHFDVDDYLRSQGIDQRRNGYTFASTLSELFFRHCAYIEMSIWWDRLMEVKAKNERIKNRMD